MVMAAYGKGKEGEEVFVVDNFRIGVLLVGR